MGLDFFPSLLFLIVPCYSPALRMQEERVLHEAKLAKMEAEMKLVFQQKVQEKEAKLKQSEEELYARHREMKESLEKQRLDLEEKKRKIENGRPLTPEKGTVRYNLLFVVRLDTDRLGSRKQGRVSFVLELLDRYYIFICHESVHSYPCLPFHGVSIAICATLSSSDILLSRLLCLLCPGLCAVGTRHTRLHGYPKHVSPQFPSYEYLLVFSFPWSSPLSCR